MFFNLFTRKPHTVAVVTTGKTSTPVTFRRVRLNMEILAHAHGISTRAAEKRFALKDSRHDELIRAFRSVYLDAFTGETVTLCRFHS